MRKKKRTIYDVSHTDARWEVKKWRAEKRRRDRKRRAQEGLERLQEELENPDKLAGKITPRGLERAGEKKERGRWDHLGN